MIAQKIKVSARATISLRIKLAHVIIASYAALNSSSKVHWWSVNPLATAGVVLIVA